MRRPAARSAINISAMTRKYDVDQLIPLRNYYRIADNLLKQASIHREEKNIIDLYVMLVRYSSLVSETIPYHRDYMTSYPKERSFNRKKLLSVMTELEALKPQVQQQLEAIKREETADQYLSASPNNGMALGYNNERLQQASTSMIAWPSFKQYDDNHRVSSSNTLDSQLQKLSLSLPLPKQETLSKHSLLGPNGLRGQWQGPTSGIKVNYPTYAEPSPNEIPSHNQTSASQVSSEMENSAMASVLSLDDWRWPSIDRDSVNPLGDEVRDNFPLIRQPSPPPVLAQVKPEYRPLSPSKVADPRPGPAKSSPDSTPGSNSFQHLHIPMKMLDDFLRLAQKNTARNLETCGVLAGSLKNRVFHISTLIVPKQESTSDSCQTLNEEEIFDYQDKYSLFPLGWIHTHPTQTCFMSSVDLHTHYSYQVMLPEAIAIVMAPTDTSCPHGIFHLSDPSGVKVIRNCQQRGFHPHEEPDDGTPIYEHCSHVYMNANLKFEVVDLR